ncbi:hypothetical protein C8J56DRAFT_714460, partial [Mycena floridula]
FEEVTWSEAKEAIWKNSNTSAPGQTQITYRLVKWAWQVDDQLIYLLYRHCLRMGYHPRKWRKAIALALRKPRKPNYSNPRAYRLITLLECLGKPAESI